MISKCYTDSLFRYFFIHVDRILVWQNAIVWPFEILVRVLASSVFYHFVNIYFFLFVCQFKLLHNKTLLDYLISPWFSI